MISHKHKAIFVHVPKTAGSSMRRCIEKRGFGAVEYHAPDGSNDNVTGVYVNGTAWRIKRNLLSVWDDYFKFAFVRNPWDRMVSCWANRGRRCGDFGTFLRGYPYPQNKHDLVWHTIPQLTHMTDVGGNNMMDFIGRFENLQEDFNTICGKIGMSQKTLPHVNKSKHKHYTEYYDNETKQIVAEKYAKDIEVFGYEFGE